MMSDSVRPTHTTTTLTVLFPLFFCLFLFWFDDKSICRVDVCSVLKLTQCHTIDLWLCCCCAACCLVVWRVQMHLVVMVCEDDSTFRRAYIYIYMMVVQVRM